MEESKGHRNARGEWIVEREPTVRWYRMTDPNGKPVRWCLRTDSTGGFTFAETIRGTPITPTLYGLPAVRGWMIRNGYRPEGATGDPWDTPAEQAAA